MHHRTRWQVAQAFSQSESLHRILAEQQGMLKVEALGIRAIQMLVQAGPCQIVGGNCTWPMTITLRR